MHAMLERLLNLNPLRSIHLRIKRREFNKRFPGHNLSAHSVIPPGNIHIGRGTYGCPTIKCYHPDDSLSIGNFCSIGPEVMILTGGEHKLELPSTYPLYRKILKTQENPDVVSKGNVCIGHDVWIGARTTILSGVTIGNGAVIGAVSVVTKDIPAYSISAGNPAKPLRFRCSDEQIRSMERIAWWYWQEKRIRDNIDSFYLPIDQFIRLFDPDGTERK